MCMPRCVALGRLAVLVRYDTCCDRRTGLHAWPLSFLCCRGCWLQRKRSLAEGRSCDGYRGTASAAGLLFRSWNAGGEGSAAIVFDWERNVLEAVFEGAGLDLGSTPDLDPEDDSLRRVGGPAEHVQVKFRQRSCDSTIGGCLPSTFWAHPPQSAGAHAPMEKQVYRVV